MALSYAPTTELEAVNEILSTIGSTPLESLDNVADYLDASEAYRILHKVNREVQGDGWHFNTEICYTLNPDEGDGEIDLPANCLSCDTTGSNAWLNVTVRDQKLYDLVNHTYDFSAYSAGVEAELVLFLEWEELPEYARKYIYVKAARQFAKKLITSNTVDGLTESDEKKAWVSFQNQEARAADYNVLNQSQVQAAWLRL